MAQKGSGSQRECLSHVICCFDFNYNCYAYLNEKNNYRLLPQTFYFSETEAWKNTALQLIKKIDNLKKVLQC